MTTNQQLSSRTLEQPSNLQLLTQKKYSEQLIKTRYNPKTIPKSVIKPSLIVDHNSSSVDQNSSASYINNLYNLSPYQLRTIPSRVQNDEGQIRVQQQPSIQQQFVKTVQKQSGNPKISEYKPLQSLRSQNKYLSRQGNFLSHDNKFLSRQNEHFASFARGLVQIQEARSLESSGYVQQNQKLQLLIVHLQQQLLTSQQSLSLSQKQKKLLNQNYIALLNKSLEEQQTFSTKLSQVTSNYEKQKEFLKRLLQQKTIQLESYQVTSEKSINVISSDNEILRDKLKSYEQTIFRKQFELEQRKTINQLSLRQLNAKLKQSSGKIQESINKNNELLQLNQQLSLKNQQLSIKSQQLEAKNQQLALKTQQMSLTNKQLSNQLNATSNKLKSSLSQLNSTSLHLQSLHEQFHKIQQDHSSTKLSYQTLEQSYRSLEAQNLSQMQQITLLTSTKESLSKRLQQSQLQLSLIKQHSTRVTSQHITLEQQHKTLQQANNKLITEIQSLKQQVLTKNASIQQLQIQTNELSAQLQNLTKQYQLTQHNHEEELSSYHQLQLSLKQQLSNLAKQLENSKEKQLLLIESEKNSRNQFSLSLQRKNKAIESLMSENQRLYKQLNKAIMNSEDCFTHSISKRTQNDQFP